MNLSREAKLLSGITLLAIPTIMYGGITLLGVLTSGEAGLTAGDIVLDDMQWALWRAGHAHAGVWVLLSLVMQVLIDAARLSAALKWIARIAAPTAAIAVSGGFFGLAFFPSFALLLYAGATLLIVALLLTGVGLLRNLDGQRL